MDFQDNAKGAVNLLQCVNNDLADERRRVVALKMGIDAIREEKGLLLEDRVNTRKECREARVESEEKLNTTGRHARLWMPNKTSGKLRRLVERRTCKRP